MVGKVGKECMVGKVGKVGKEGRLREQRLPTLYQILQQSSKNGEKINILYNFIVEIWKKFVLDTDI